jgi:PAS domain S-box-containing protein
MRGSHIDISRRKQAEEALWEAMERFQIIFEKSPIAMELYDNDGKALLINQTCIDIFGITDPEAALNFNFFDDPHMPPDIAQKIKNHQTARFVMHHDFDKIKKLGIYNTSKSGSAELDVMIVPLSGDYESTAGFLVNIQDITERKLAENALRESEQQFDLFMQHLPAAVFIKDEQGRMVYANERFAQAAGCKVEDLVGKSTGHMMPPHLERQFKKENQRVFNGETIVTETGYPEKGGITHFINYKFPIHKKGKTRLMGSVSLDITKRKLAEAGLRKSSIIIESTSDAVIATDTQGNITFWNRGAETIYGYRKDEAMGRPIRMLYREEDLHILQSMTARLLEGKNIPGIEVTCVDKYNNDVHILLSLTFIKDDAGNVTELVGITKDITERIKAENALRDSEHQRQKLAMQTEQLSLAAGELLSIEDPQILFTRISKSIVELSDFSRVIISLFKDEPPYREIIGFGGIEEETIDRLREIEMPASWYDGVFERGITIGHFSYYIPHTMKGMLNQEATIYGEGPAPDSENAWHPEDNLFVRMNNEKGKFIGVISVDDSKSGLRPTDEVVRPLEIFASLISQIIILRNEQHKRKELEQQLLQTQKMDALGTLASGIAHDFNNILAAIMGYSELAHDELDPGHPVREDIAEITKAANKAKHLIRQILTFSRKAEGEQRLLSLNRAAKNAGEILKRTLPKMVELDFELEQGLGMIKADPHQIEQVFLNLATNAADAIEGEGKISISTKAIHIDRQVCETCGSVFSGEYLMLSVRDTGSGMSPEIKARIFDPFFTTKDVGKGTGLGLSTVFGIVNAHNGHISCHSMEEVGSNFIIYLPVSNATGPADKISPVTGGPALGGDENILLVDDEQTVRDIANRMLSRQGYGVMQADCGENALSIYQEHSNYIDLVILDLGMPGMGGKACLSELRRIDPQAKVLIASGYIQYENSDELSELGAAGLVAKPYRKNDFLKRVREALDA